MSAHLLSLRGHVAYLRLYNEWRLNNEPVGALQFEPEPKKVTAAIEAVTRHCLTELNKSLANKESKK